MCPGHAHILTSHLTAGHAAWEGGCEHFRPNKQPALSAAASPPSLFLPEVETGHMRLRYLCPPLPAPTAPTAAAAAHTTTQPAWLIISGAGKFWQTRSVCEGRGRRGGGLYICCQRHPCIKSSSASSLLSSRASPFSCAVFTVKKLVWDPHRGSEMLGPNIYGNKYVHKDTQGVLMETAKYNRVLSPHMCVCVCVRCSSHVPLGS